MQGKSGRIVQVVVVTVVTLLLAGSVLVMGGTEAINFPATTVGQTRTAQFTYTLTPESATSAAVSIAVPASPFGIDGALSFSLSPGQSRTFNVTFSPTAAQPYADSFTITAIGGFPPQMFTEVVSLTGTGTSATSGTIWDLFPGVTITPGQSTEETPELAQVEAKLDGIGTVLDEFRSKLDSLGWWLGRLTHGSPIAIEPYSTNPMPQTNTWEQLAQLEAKLDQLLEQPADITVVDIYVIIMQINTLILDINQWVINLGGNTAALETKLDALEGKVDDIHDGIFDVPGGLIDLIDGPGGLIDLIDGMGGVIDLIDGVGGVLDGIYGVPGGILSNIAVLEAKADANAVAIASLAGQVQVLLASNSRIEDMLKQQQGYPAAPDASKITLAMGGGPLPNVSLEASVIGTAGVVGPNAEVTIYWPIGLPPSTVTADSGGAFSLTIGTGSVIYFGVDVTQTDAQGRESGRVNVPASP